MLPSKAFFENKMLTKTTTGRKTKHKRKPAEADVYRAFEEFENMEQDEYDRTVRNKEAMLKFAMKELEDEDQYQLEATYRNVRKHQRKQKRKKFVD